jgi:hypothetical protein
MTTPIAGTLSRHRELGSVTRQPEWDDDPLRRSLIERAPPLTWKGILGYALASSVGLILGIVKMGGLWEGVAFGLFILGAIQVLRGTLRLAWLRLGGTDRPLRTYLRRRLGR